MFFKSPTEQAAERLIEEQLYAQVAKELAENKQNVGIWAKAIAKSKGDEIKAKGLYIEYRVQSIKDELVIKEELAKVHGETKTYKTTTPERKILPENEKSKEESKKAKEESKKEFKKAMALFLVMLSLAIIVSAIKS